MPVKRSMWVYLSVVLMRCGLLAWLKNSVTYAFMVFHGAAGTGAWAPVR